MGHISVTLAFTLYHYIKWKQHSSTDTVKYVIMLIVHTPVWIKTQSFHFASWILRKVQQLSHTKQVYILYNLNRFSVRTQSSDPQQPRVVMIMITDSLVQIQIHFTANSTTWCYLNLNTGTECESRHLAYDVDVQHKRASDFLKNHPTLAHSQPQPLSDL